MTGARENRIRLSFLINDLSRAGAETQLVELALALDRSRYDVEIVLVKHRNDFADVLAAGDVPVVALNRRGWWDALVLWRLYKHLLDRRPGILHSYLFFANALGAVAGRWAGVPKIVLSQRCSYEATLTPFWRRVARLSHRLADRVVINSEAARQEELRAGFPADKIVHIPSGIRIAAPPATSRESLGLPAGPLVLALGQLDAVKGHRYLVEAWTRVREARPGARLVFVGDGPCRADLETQVRTRGLGDAVLFRGFRAPAAPYLAACDLLVQPSLSEGMPNAVLEAMALGKAVVATRVGGVQELVADGETGLLVPSRDPEALAAAIVTLLSDPERRAALAEAGRARVAERFSLARVAGLTESIYRETSAGASRLP